VTYTKRLFNGGLKYTGKKRGYGGGDCRQAIPGSKDYLGAQDAKTAAEDAQRKNMKKEKFWGRCEKTRGERELAQQDLQTKRTPKPLDGTKTSEPP